MLNRTVKFIGSAIWVLLALLVIFNAWLFMNSQLNTVMYDLFFSILLLSLVFTLFLIEIKKLEKENIGLTHVLEKSEESRINAENLKSKILLMVNDLPEGILIIDKDDKISVINNRAEKFLGINRRQALNKTILGLGHLSNVKKIVFPLLVNFKAAHKEEIQVRKNFVLDLTIQPLVLGKNDTAKLIILHDITKIKYAQEEKNQFVSVAAHQLKSPLSATKLSLKMMLDGEFGKINKEQKDILEKTYKKNDSLIYLVDSLLKEARTDEPEQLDNRAPINLENLVSQVVDFYKDEMKRKKINFKFKKPDKKLPEVLADPERIEMVIQNLFDNAVKYTPLKGKIEINITPQRDQVEFAIKDSGIGIPEDQKGKIFTRFSRGINVVKTKTAGSGLGLSIAKEIIEKHHGRIWFESKENEGSTFFFSLPFIGG